MFENGVTEIYNSNVFGNGNELQEKYTDPSLVPERCVDRLQRSLHRRRLRSQLDVRANASNITAVSSTW